MQLIPVQDAVKHAKQSLLALYADDLPKQVALEEIELVKDGTRDLWAVTLGFFRHRDVRERSASLNFSLAGLNPDPIENRVYKTISIDAEKGEFVKMDIRRV